MGVGFEYKNRIRFEEMNELTVALSDHISTHDMDRLNTYKEFWDFYEGYHWEKIPLNDKPQITKNYCRAFVDKFVAFEFGLGFVINVPVEEDDIEETPSPITDFLNEVWEYNNRKKFCIEFGQNKAVTGDGWVQVKYEEVGSFSDPYEEFPNGRIRVLPISSSVVFPTYDVHDKDKLESVTIMYPIEERYESPVLRRVQYKKTVYKQIWTKDSITVINGNEDPKTIPNKYGVIPFVQVKNIPLANRSRGLSDLEDIIPLNVELNLKDSDISEIIDYHSAPVTVVFGAKVSALEKGANKMWGGLPKDARVENLTMNTDLGASVQYTHSLKTAMHEIGGVPENALGASQPISNTSGVALQLVNMPLIERTRVKRLSSAEGIEKINKLILLIGLKEGLVEIPPNVSTRDFYINKVTFPDTLPKDYLIELQQIEVEMRLGLESRYGAMERLGRKDTKKTLQAIEADMDKNSHFYNVKQLENEIGKLNSGMTNGETQKELVRKELNGENS